MKQRSSGRRGTRPRPVAGVLEDVAAGRFRSSYVVLGDNLLLVDEFLHRLRAALIEPGFEPFDYETLSIEDKNIVPAVIEQRVRQAPVGSRRRLVVISDITRMGSKGPAFPQVGKARVEALFELMARAPDTACCVAVGIAKKELDPLLRAHGLGPGVIDAGQPGAGDLLVMARKWARQQGISLEPDAARLLLEIVGGDAGTVRAEVGKLATVLDAGATATVATVREFAAASREFTLREYVDCVVRREPGPALAVLRKLQAWGETIPHITTWLVTALLDQVAYKAGVLPKWKEWSVRPAAARWRDTGELNRCLQGLYALCRDFFAGKPEPFARLEAFTWCVACPGRSDRCDVYADGREHLLCMVPRRRRKNG
jgi:DNA polymerase III delta subunit